MEINDLLLLLRISYGLGIIGIVVAVVWWGIKNGQFSNQGKAGKLPFEVEEKNAKE